ncbi:unnamed protein product [Durusdinium trenchii]|uniref:RanBD1 domain-containing protein n=1 Tax=Durusdinium trenchii TaxID=1381693 RepID=A0ABP0RNX3_9DINO
MQQTKLMTENLREMSQQAPVYVLYFLCPDNTAGEEDEEVIFRADCKLWKLVKLEDGKAEGWRWQERGCGIVHINRHKTSGAGRLVMRMRGVLKLLLNTPIFPTTRYEKVGQKSVRFVGVDTEESQSCHGEARVD